MNNRVTKIVEKFDFGNYVDKKISQLKSSDFNLETKEKITLKDTSCKIILFHGEDEISFNWLKVFTDVASGVAGILASVNLFQEKELAIAFYNLGNDENNPLSWAKVTGTPPFILTYQRGNPVGFYNGDINKDLIINFIFQSACKEGYRDYERKLFHESDKANSVGIRKSGNMSTEELVEKVAQIKGLNEKETEKFKEKINEMTPEKVEELKQEVAEKSSKPTEKPEISKEEKELEEDMKAIIEDIKGSHTDNPGNLTLDEAIDKFKKLKETDTKSFDKIIKYYRENRNKVNKFTNWTDLEMMIQKAIKGNFTITGYYE